MQLPTLTRRMDAILILGAAVWRDGPSPTLRRRTAHAARLWHQGVAPVVVPCGGLGECSPSEAAVMQDLLEAEDVPPNAILQEDKSTSTLENIRNAKRLIGDATIVIVTDSYHARRALMVARHFGLTATASCPEPDTLQIKQTLRELLALPAYAMRLWATPLDD